MKSYLASKEKTACCGCRACEQVCPHNCIKMIADEKGFIYPDIDKSACISCGLCEKVCPYTKDDSHAAQDKTQCYALIHKNDDILAKSASGGAFTALVDTFCDSNYAIFGVEFDKSLIAIHSYTQDKGEYAKFRRSKYVQSDTRTAFSDAKKLLNDGKKVLFTGTPCQIIAFKKFLQRDFENLLCVDLVCHGVASPKVFSQWCDYIEKKEKKKITDYNMRYKRKTADGYSIANTKIEFDDGSSIMNGYVFGYSQLFFKNIGYRDCCYSCDCYSRRASDITIGDCWGIQSFAPHLYDGRGVSLLLINSEKGKELFSAISKREDVKTEEVSFDDCTKENPNLWRNTYLKPKEEKKFWKRYSTLPIEKAITRSTLPKLRYRIISVLISLIPKSVKDIVKKCRKNDGTAD